MIDLVVPGADDDQPGTGYPPDAIAVIGYAGRFPGAPDAERYWVNLRDGADVRAEFTEEDLDLAGVDPSVRADPAFVRHGYALEGAEMFDAEFFGMSPAEATLVDPQQRLFLECVWEAFEHAGHLPGGPVALFAGEGLSGHLLTVARAYRGGTDLVAAYQALTANDKDFLTTRVSYKLGLTGPSIAVQTACSTSLVAVHLAVQSLLTGECELAVAGGVSVWFPQRAGYLPQQGMILSADGRCRPFDAAAGGTVRGDGLGAVVLRRLDEAMAEGDTVHGVILGSAVNNDGSAKLGFSATSVQRQREVVVQAMEVAGITADSVSYVEAHGTGTDLGDPAEVLALARAFGTDPATPTTTLGSVKANIGHLDAAAGMAGLLKVLLMLRHRQIPPLLHHTGLNPKIDLAGRFAVSTELTPWSARGTPRRAGVSSLGIGGTNAHLVLEEGPEPAPAPAGRPVQLLLLSARTPTALTSAATRLAARLRAPDAPALADTAYTTQVGRVGFTYRRFVRCRSAGEAALALERSDEPTLAPPDEPASVVFLLPGQGAQRVGMGRLLYEREPVFHDAADRVAELFRTHLGSDLRSVLYGRPSAEAEHRLAETSLTQAALFTTQYALAELLSHWGIRPGAVIGHSIGEITAACLAAVFSLPAAVELVSTRGRLLSALPPGGMLSVALDEEAAAELAGRFEVELAAVNSERDCVLAGPSERIAALGERLDADGVDHRLLRTAHAFHSAAVEPVLAGYADAVRAAGPRPARIPTCSNLTGAWLTPEQAVDPHYWTGQLRAPVRFEAGMRTVLNDHGGPLLELGAGRTLAALARRHRSRRGRAVLGTLGGLSAASGDEHEAVIDAVGRLWSYGVDVDWAGFHAGHQRRRVPLPGYPFQREHFRLKPPDEPTQFIGMPDDHGDRLYLPSWRRAGPAPAASGASRRWLLIGGRPEFAEAVATGLTATGHQADRISRPGDHAVMLGELRSTGQVPDAVVLLVEPGVDPGKELAALYGALDHDGFAAPVWMCASRLCRVESTDEVEPRWAGALGLAAIRGADCHVVDIGAAPDPLALAAELDTAEPAPLVCLRGTLRWLPDWTPQPVSAARPPTGTYLMLGDGGGIGDAVADRLTVHGVRVLRVGRSSSPSVSVTDRAGMGALFASAGPLDGVVYAVDAPETAAEGALVLAEVIDTQARPPRSCLLLCASAGVPGNPVAPGTAVAGAIEQALSAVRSGHGPTRWTTASWDRWRADDQDLAAIDRLLSEPVTGPVLVSAEHPARRRPVPDTPSAVGVAASPAAAPAAPDVAGMEQLVRQVWLEVLGLSEVDPEGNFFDIGGDSMTGLRVIRALSERCGVDLTPVDVFEAPTVRSLAALLAARSGRAGAGPSTTDTSRSPATGSATNPVTEQDQRADRRRSALRGRTARGGAEND